jgi:hypothetical protein
VQVVQHEERWLADSEDPAGEAFEEPVPAPRVDHCPGRSDGFGKRKLVLSAVDVARRARDESIDFRPPGPVERGQRSLHARMAQPVSSRFQS